jgi:hypothetical protein
VTILTNGEPAHARQLMQASLLSLNRSLDHYDHVIFMKIIVGVFVDRNENIVPLHRQNE